MEGLAVEDDVAIAAITVAELRGGALLARGKAATGRAAFVDDVVAALPVIAYDISIAESHARTSHR